MFDKPKGLYAHQTDELIFSWKELLSERLVKVGNNYLSHVDPKLEGDLVLPNGLDGFYNLSLENCDFIYDIYLPQSFSGAINTLAFSPSKGKKRIFFHPENKCYITIDNCVVDLHKKCIIQCFNYGKIPSDERVTSIGYASFSFTDYVEITIPKQIEKIASNAFSSCPTLTKLYFEDMESNWYIKKKESYSYTDSYDYTRPSMMHTRVENLVYEPFDVSNPEKAIQAIRKVSSGETFIVKGKI